MDTLMCMGVQPWPYPGPICIVLTVASDHVEVTLQPGTTVTPHEGDIQFKSDRSLVVFTNDSISALMKLLDLVRYQV